MFILNGSICLFFSNEGLKTSTEIFAFFHGSRRSGPSHLVAACTGASTNRYLEPFRTNSVENSIFLIFHCVLFQPFS